MLASVWKSRRPAAVLLSMLWSRIASLTPAASSALATSQRWRTLRPTRSSFTATTASTSRRWTARIISSSAGRLARAPSLGFARYIISATTPFTRDDLAELRTDAPAVLRRCVPAYVDEYARRGWSMFPSIYRVYVNERARRELRWKPCYDFAALLDQLRANRDPRSPLARAIGSKGYHAERFSEGPYPV